MRPAEFRGVLAHGIGLLAEELVPFARRLEAAAPVYRQVEVEKRTDSGAQAAP